MPQSAGEHPMLSSVGLKELEDRLDGDTYGLLYHTLILPGLSEHWSLSKKATCSFLNSTL